jgi:hypothetical protein
MKKKNDFATMAAELLIQARVSDPLKQLPENCRPTNIGVRYP